MKTLYIILLMLISITSFSQFNKGEKYFGGYLGVQLQNQPTGSNGATTFKNNYFSFTPSLGIFIKNTFAIGGTLGYSNQYYKASNGNNYTMQTSHSYSSSLFARQYFAVSDKFFATVTGGIHFSRGVTKYGVNAMENVSNYFYLSSSISPGLVFFPSEHWSLEATFGSLGYSYQKYFSQEKGVNNIGLNLGSVSIGLVYYFRKKSGE